MKYALGAVGGVVSVLFIEYVVVFHSTIPQQIAEHEMARQAAAMNELLKGVSPLPLGAALDRCEAQ